MFTISGDKLMNFFKNKTALITGASSGIGRQLACDLFIQKKCHLILTDIDQEGLDQLAQELASLNQSQSVQTFCFDISCPQAISDFAQQMESCSVNFLINNAGIFYSGTFEKMDIEHFEKLIQTNLMGTIRLTRKLLPQLLNHQESQIVNISSLAGLVGAPGMCAYSTAKFGLVGFSQALATELYKRVHVLTVCPSTVKTNIAHNALYAEDDSQGNSEINSLHQFVQSLGTTPQKVSKNTIKAMHQKKRIILINADSYFFYYLHKFFPGVSEKFLTMLYSKLKSKGVVN